MIFRTYYFNQMSSEPASQNSPTYKIILVGDSGVGKTSLFWRYVENQTLPDQPMTVIDFRYKQVNLYEQQARLCIWDTAGQQKFRSIVATYFKSCQGVVLVCDLSNKQSWKNVKNIWYDLAFRRASKATFVLLGNKSDLKCEVQLQQINRWCAEKGVYFVKTCALTGQNVDQAFFTLAALIDSKQDQSLSIFSSFALTNGNMSFGDTTTESVSIRPNFQQNYIDIKSNTSFFLKKEDKKIPKKKSCN